MQFKEEVGGRKWNYLASKANFKHSNKRYRELEFDIVRQESYSDVLKMFCPYRYKMEAINLFC